MTRTKDWRSGVTVLRREAVELALAQPGGRTTVFNFAGSGGRETWLGAVTLPPRANTGPHHHGRHEVAIYVVRGRSEIRWGDRLEFAAEVGPGDFVSFAPFVPHQEINLGASETLDLVVVRSDDEKIAIALDTVPVERPETVF